jgi:group I intron endonuclease
MENNIEFVDCCSNSGVYKISSADGYFYIGSTVNINNRWKEHKNKLLNDTHENTHIRNRFKKYNQLWRFEFLEETAADYEYILQREQHYLDLLFHDKKCMNINPSASKPPSQLGKSKSVIHTARIILSKLQRGIYKNVNIEDATLRLLIDDEATECTIRDICIKLLNKEELNIEFKGTCQRGIPRPDTSERMKGNTLRKGCVGTFTGRKHTEEAKEKIRQSRLNRDK